MKPVLVSYDGSDEARDSLLTGTELAMACDADLLVALPDPFEGGNGSTARDRRAPLDTVVDDAMARVARLGFRGRAIWGSATECLDYLAEGNSAHGEGNAGHGGPARLELPGRRLAAASGAVHRPA